MYFTCSKKNLIIDKSTRFNEGLLYCQQSKYKAMKKKLSKVSTGVIKDYFGKIINKKRKK